MPWSGSPRTFVDGEVETASTFNTEVRDRMNFLISPPSASAVTSVSLEVVTGTNTPVPVDAEVFDTDGIHSTVTNNSRFTVQTSGKYMFRAAAGWAGDSGGTYRVVALALNGDLTNVMRFASAEIDGHTNLIGIETTVMRAFADGDYVEAMVSHDAGHNVSVDVGLECKFEAE